MPAARLSIPSYRHHKPSGQAVVTLNGHDFYLGRHGSPESRNKYDRLVAEWLSNGRRLQRPDAESASVNEILQEYLKWAEIYYVRDGRPTSEVSQISYAIRPVQDLYGDLPASQFGSRQLKAVRQRMIDSGRVCRNTINRRIRIVVRVFKWAAAEGLVPAPVYHGLQTVPGLRRGRCGVRDAPPVRPVPDVFVDAIRPYVSQRVWCMIQLQRLTAMRPGEVCVMRTIDIDRSGAVWVYTPQTHKTEHLGRERQIYLGPRAQAILEPWLRPELTAYLFQPCESEAERRGGRSLARPGRRRRKEPGERYTTGSYRRAIHYAIRRANAHLASDQWIRPIWSPNQLRHGAATRIRREYGLDVARAVLGHSSPRTTEIYAELDALKAADAMKRIG